VSRKYIKGRKVRSKELLLVDLLLCYDKDSKKAVQNGVRRRHYHKGFMADYKYAKVLVEQAVKTGKEPLLASWF